MELQQVMKDFRVTENGVCHGASGKQRKLSDVREEQQVSEVVNESEALTKCLMEKVCNRANLNRAYKRVFRNKGAGGVDGMTVNELLAHCREHKEELIRTLLGGSYKPQKVRGVEIPKPAGGKRQLGIPTVVDRLVQQAIVQVLEPILDPTFSESSYGFRPSRNAHQALTKAQKYVQEGREIVVDIDLEKFFDRVNHDILMSRLAKRIADKRLLKIIRRFLAAGIMQQGVHIERREGMPQGGNLSPLLSNFLLDELDKELEKRGHKFCRYADDCNIYVCSQKAGERVMASIKKFLCERLRLKLNENKSCVAEAKECKFLGYKLLNDGKLIIAQESLQRLKDKVRKLTKRNRGVELAKIIKQLNEQLTGWIGYFKLTEYRGQLISLDGWIRRKLRCYRLKQRKRNWSIATFLILLGAKPNVAWRTAKSGKGWWRLSRTPALHAALSNAWFEELGLVNLEYRAIMLNA
jgi:RNA-directed DNA polymerase